MPVARRNTVTNEQDPELRSETTRNKNNNVTDRKSDLTKRKSKDVTDVTDRQRESHLAATRPHVGQTQFGNFGSWVMNRSPDVRR